MNQKVAVIGLLVFVLAAFGGLAFYDAKYGHKFERLLGRDIPQKQNWRWQDRWDSKDQNSQLVPDKIGPQQPLPDAPTQQLMAGNYAESLKMSSETGRPVLVFFTAEWCQWCKKMKSETMNDSSIQPLLKNYILVYIDTDKNRAPAQKFGVTTLPSYVITNMNEENLKSGNGFKNSNSFASWLDNPSLYVQPRSPQILPPQELPPKTQPQPKDRRRPFQRNQPQPNSPDCGPNG